MESKKLFIVILYTVYGGEWHAAAYAENKEEAIKKARGRHNITDENWQEVIAPGLYDSEPVEISFDENGVSSLWYVSTG